MLRRVALAALISLVLVPAASAADIHVSPRAFSPAAAKLDVRVALPEVQRVGVRLDRRGGGVVGWLAPPERRRFLRLRWDGKLDGKTPADGEYRVRLVSAGRSLGTAPLTIDRTAPRLTAFRAYTRTARFRGDGPLLTTISPNGDGRRDVAKLEFRLDEDAKVHFEVARTTFVAEPIYELNARLKAGRRTLTWFPNRNVGARTYLTRITVTDKAGNRRTFGASNATYGRRPTAPVIRVLGLDAGFTRESYTGGEVASLSVETDVDFQLQVFRAGPETVPTYSDTIMNGVPVTDPVAYAWAGKRNAASGIYVPVGPWQSGLYFAKLTGVDGKIGYAPFVVRPPALGSTSRVAVVIPTNTWQAYNFRDRDGNGWGDTWYARGRENTVALGRAQLRRGVPPQYRKYELGFLRWLVATGKSPEFVTETDLEAIPSGDELAKLYDLVVFPGHTEYVTRREYDLVQRYRDLGGNLAFLASNNFFWEVRLDGRTLTRVRLWRDQGRPEAAVLGVQYRANDRGRLQRPFLVRSAATAPWLWEGTGLVDGDTIGAELGGYGIEIDATTPASPPGTIVLAEIPDLFGPGLTAQMSYYETEAGAKVFSAGAMDFGGTALLPAVSRMLANLWARLAAP